MENGPWYDDVLLPRLQAARAEGGPTAERPLASLRLAGFADVLDHLALVDADDGADADPRHLEHPPLLSLHVESNGRCERSLFGANEPLRTLEVRAVAGRRCAPSPVAPRSAGGASIARARRSPTQRCLRP